jgi:hypothetical protein
MLISPVLAPRALSHAAAARPPGIKLHGTRMLRLMEVLLHISIGVLRWRSAEAHEATLSSFGLAAERYSLTQLAYDLRKVKPTS